MINVSEATKNAFKGDTSTIHVAIYVPELNIALDDSSIVNESLSLKESIEENTNLTFEGCNASIFSFECEDLPQDISGKYIEAFIGADEATETICIFRGYVDSVTNKNHQDMTMKVLAYDRMYDIVNTDVTAWYNGFGFPITLKFLRDNLASLLGIEQEPTVLPNDSEYIYKSITDSNITAGTILKNICQLNARYGRINRYGKLEYIKLEPIIDGLYPAEDLYPSDDLFPRDENSSELVAKNTYRSIEYEPFKTELITGAFIHTSTGAKYFAGTDANGFHISENKLADGLANPQAVINNIFAEIRDVTFNPCYVTTSGMPYIECGDIITLNTYKKLVRNYILSRSLTGIQNLKDAYDSQCDQYQPKYVENAIQKNTSATYVAQSTANSAQSTADTANYNAGVAKGVADTAKSTADGAVTRIANIESDYVKATRLEADVANLGYTKITTADVNNLIANNATVKGKLSASDVTANYIAGKFTTGNSANFPWISCTNIKCSSGIVFDYEGATRTFKPKTININGTNYRVLAN